LKREQLTGQTAMQQSTESIRTGALSKWLAISLAVLGCAGALTASAFAGRAMVLPAPYLAVLGIMVGSAAGGIIGLAMGSPLASEFCSLFGAVCGAVAWWPAWVAWMLLRRDRTEGDAVMLFVIANLHFGPMFGGVGGIIVGRHILGFGSAARIPVTWGSYVGLACGAALCVGGLNLGVSSELRVPLAIYTIVATWMLGAVVGALYGAERRRAQGFALDQV
jgi:hypothetical protein